MPLVVVDEGEPTLLRLMLKAALVEDEPFALHLFVNDFTPARDSVLADFVEASGSWYFAQLLDRSVWTVPMETVGAAYTFWGVDPITWTTLSGPYTIHGYYVTDEEYTRVIWCERFSAPWVLDLFNPLVLTLFMRLRSEVEP